MFEKLDNTISILTESAVRAISRRCLIASAVKGVVAATAALTLGIFTEAKSALAIDWTTCNSSCTCHWAGGSGNANCPQRGGCPNYGCPSGCSVCTTSSGCGSICNYSDGAWCACNHLGTCGNGYKLCVDCRCNGCSYICTCRSACYCCSCCTTKDVEEEMRRLAALSLQTA